MMGSRRALGRGEERIHHRGTENTERIRKESVPILTPVSFLLTPVSSSPLCVLCASVVGPLP